MRTPLPALILILLAVAAAVPALSVEGLDVEYRTNGEATESCTEESGRTGTWDNDTERSRYTEDMYAYNSCSREYNGLGARVSQNGSEVAAIESDRRETQDSRWDYTYTFEYESCPPEESDSCAFQSFNDEHHDRGSTTTDSGTTVSTFATGEERVSTYRCSGGWEGNGTSQATYRPRGEEPGETTHDAEGVYDSRDRCRYGPTSDHATLILSECTYFLAEEGRRSVPEGWEHRYGYSCGLGPWLEAQGVQGGVMLVDYYELQCRQDAERNETCSSTSGYAVRGGALVTLPDGTTHGAMVDRRLVDDSGETPTPILP